MSRIHELSCNVSCKVCVAKLDRLLDISEIGTMGSVKSR